jgi:hypothetical protein
MLTFALAGELKRKKTWWLHPINQKRNKLGTFHTLVSELRLYDRFKDYLRLNIYVAHVVVDLVQLQQHHITWVGPR